MCILFDMKIVYAGLILVLIFIQPGNLQLIRSNEVYQTFIQDVFAHYQCASVILFYAQEPADNVEAVETFTRLKNLHKSLSKNMIPTTITSVDAFVRMNGQYLENLGNKLLVFLDDSGVLMHQIMTELAPLTDTSQSIWLIFTKAHTVIEDLFSDFYVPYNGQFMISKRDKQFDGDYEIIIEIYKISRESKLMQNIIGRWRRGHGIYEYSSLNVFERRIDMGGHEMRVIAQPTMIEAFEKSDKIHPNSGRDFFIIIFDTLQRGLNFTTIFQETSDIGKYLPNGTWTGAIATLINQTSDILLTSIRMNSDIMRVIECTTPFYLSKDTFYFQQQDKSTKRNTFLQPFGKGIWIILGCLILCSGTLIKLVILFHQKQYPQIRINRTSLNSSCPFLDVFGAMCGQAMPTSQITSVRVIQYIIHLTAIVIIAAYSGVLTSTLATSGKEKISTTLEDIINDDTFEVGMILNVANELLFKNSEDKKIRQLTEKKQLFKIPMPSTSREGLKWACDRRKYAFMTSHLIVESMKPKDCHLLSTETVIHVSVGFGIQRNSPYRGIINFYFSLLRENGILKKTWDDSHNTPLVESKNTIHSSVEFYDIVPILFFLGGFYALSILFLLFERLIHARMERIRHQKRCRSLELSFFLRSSNVLQHVKSIENNTSFRKRMNKTYHKICIHYSDYVLRKRARY